MRQDSNRKISPWSRALISSLILLAGCALLMGACGDEHPRPPQAARVVQVVDGDTVVVGDRGVDTVAPNAGAAYVYQRDAGAKRLLWLGRERTELTLRQFFGWLGQKRTRDGRIAPRRGAVVCGIVRRSYIWCSNR